MNMLRLVLFALVAFGTYGSGRLAWLQWSTGEACPVVGSVPACYVAFAGYFFMIAALIGLPKLAWLSKAFYTGITIAGGLALVGTVLELVKGNVCPRVGSIPMCYISLAMSLLIVGLFYVTTKPAATIGSTQA